METGDTEQMKWVVGGGKRGEEELKGSAGEEILQLQNIDIKEQRCSLELKVKPTKNRKSEYTKS